MKTNAFKGLFLLLCLCLLSCGGKAQEAEEKKTVEVPQPGAYGFPKEMDVKCEVVLKVTFNYSLDNVTWTRSSVYPWAHGREEYALYYYEDGQWKDITEETIAPELREAFRKILMGDSHLFAGVDYTTEIPLYNYSASSVKKGFHLFAGVDYTTEIPLYNYSASSVKKGLYKILFAINRKPCYVIFEL